ncbi:MAG TPA: M48 family metalloprotease [Syntrophales bacterium]|nr:M48 family metalloprotease [Syntrophales bacterium]HPX56589.1 M48 family metalloprotease [Syntrophales bacterium]HQN77293.1 M48 family metalloprotease [Syntrophales bacterium]HQQ26281.1 M48 family metalloprotease [Syntrophales bacterium]
MKSKIVTPILLSLLIVASCAPTTASRYREGSNVGQETGMTVDDERRLTEEALPKMRKDYPSLKNQELQTYVSNLGMKIVRANNLEGNPYHYDFEVVDVNTVNAFAMPAGKIFVTAPLIAMASNEAELAGVLSHEVGHVMARHTAERMYVMEKNKNKTWLYTAGGGIVGAAAGFGLGSLLCPEDDADCLAKAALIGGALGAGGGLLVQKYQFMANSREDELEADRIGFRMSVGAGYDKDQVGKFYEKLLLMEEQAQATGNPIIKSIADAMSTHPPSKERVKQMNEMAMESPSVKNSVTNTPEFNEMKKIVLGLQKKGRQ